MLLVARRPRRPRECLDRRTGIETITPGDELLHFQHLNQLRKTLSHRAPSPA